MKPLLLGAKKYMNCSIVICMEDVLAPNVLNKIIVTNQPTEAWKSRYYRKIYINVHILLVTEIKNF